MDFNERMVTKTVKHDREIERLKSVEYLKKASHLSSLWTPLTDGDVATPELVFSGGDVIMVEVEI